MKKMKLKTNEMKLFKLWFNRGSSPSPPLRVSHRNEFNVPYRTIPKGRVFTSISSCSRLEDALKNVRNENKIETLVDPSSLIMSNSFGCGMEVALLLTSCLFLLISSVVLLCRCSTEIWECSSILSPQFSQNKVYTLKQWSRTAWLPRRSSRNVSSKIAWTSPENLRQSVLCGCILIRLRWERSIFNVRS